MPRAGRPPRRQARYRLRLLLPLRPPRYRLRPLRPLRPEPRVPPNVRYSHRPKLRSAEPTAGPCRQPLREAESSASTPREYPGDNAGVAIFAHQSPSVFAGQVAHAPGAPVMPAISGVGDGAYGQTAGGRSVVNAYSNASRTLVAAQSSAGLSQTKPWPESASPTTDRRNPLGH